MPPEDETPPTPPPADPPKPPEVDEDDKPMTRREFKAHMAERDAASNSAEKTEVAPRVDPPKDEKPADPPPADAPKDNKPLERHGGILW